MRSTWSASEHINRRKAARTHDDHLVITIDATCRPGHPLSPETLRTIARQLVDIGHGEIGGSQRPFVGDVAKFAWEWRRRTPDGEVAS